MSQNNTYGNPVPTIGIRPYKTPENEVLLYIKEQLDDIKKDVADIKKNCKPEYSIIIPVSNSEIIDFCIQKGR